MLIECTHEGTKYTHECGAKICKDCIADHDEACKRAHEEEERYESLHQELKDIRFSLQEERGKIRKRILKCKYKEMEALEARYKSLFK